MLGEHEISGGNHDAKHNNIKTKWKSFKYYIIRFIPNGTLDIFEKMNDRFSYSVISGYC